MTLRDALATALDDTLPRMAFVKYGQYLTDDPLFDIEAYYGRVSFVILSDPAFRDALVEAVEKVWPDVMAAQSSGWFSSDHSRAIAIVARMLGEPT